MFRPIPFILIVLSCSALPFKSFGDDVPILRVYAPRSFAKVVELSIKKDFEKKHGCKLEFLTAQGIENIIMEVNISKKPRGDMILGLSYDSCKSEAVKKNFIELKHLSDKMKSLDIPVVWEDKNFLPLQVGFLSFVYDKTRIETPIEGFEDLLKGNYKIILTDPRTSVPGQSLLFWVKGVYGNDASYFWKKLKPRILTITKSWSYGYSLFLKGEAPVVLSYATSELYHKLKENNTNIVASQFKEGQYMEVLIGGVLKSSLHAELAEKLLEELLNETFQKANVFDYCCYPVVKFSDVPPSLNSYPHFIRPIVTKEWDTYKQHALDEWLESLCS